MRVVVVVLAAGLSSRFKSDKIYHKVSGLPLIIKSLKPYAYYNSAITDIVVVCREGECDRVKSLVEKYYKNPNKLKGFLKESKKNFYYVTGGESRALSSINALNFIKELNIDSDFVAITDAARCYTKKSLVSRLFLVLSKCDNAIPAIRRAETFKVIEDGKITSTLKNNYLYEIQTPQIFKTSKIQEAYRLGFEKKKWAEDDSAIYFSYFNTEKINIVKGDVSNIKVTFPEDLKR